MVNTKTKEGILAEIGNCTLEKINDSEPVHFHQGEAMSAMEEYAVQQAVEFADWVETYYRKRVLNRWEFKPNMFPDKQGDWTTKELYELFNSNA